MESVTVNCPNCGRPIVVKCSYSGGSSTASANCRSCGQLVHVQYSNDSFGFRIIDIHG